MAYTIHFVLFFCKSFVIVLLSEFNKSANLHSSLQQSLFYIAFIVVFVWLIFSFFYKFKFKWWKSAVNVFFIQIQFSVWKVNSKIVLKTKCNSKKIKWWKLLPGGDKFDYHQLEALNLHVNMLSRFEMVFVDSFLLIIRCLHCVEEIPISADLKV